MMKKITLLLFALAAFYRPSFGQAVISVDAPRYNGDWAALVGPNGFVSPSAASPTLSYAYNRACYLITQAELTRMIATNSVITDFGFDFYRPGSVAVTGQFTLYLENTADVTYNKGLTFSTLLTGMSTNYTGNLTLPGSTSQATNAVSVPLTSNFTYTGGGIYVAYDWYTSAPTSTAYARYLTSFDQSSMGANASAPIAGPAPTTLTVDTRRPAMRFKATNTATNEVGVIRVLAPGAVSKLVAGGHDITAIVKNNSINALNNVSVTLNVSGANSYTDVKTVTIPVGGTANVSFTPFSPTTNGLNNMTVSVAADEYSDNNAAAWTQSVGCTDYANNPPVAASVFSNGSYGYGGQAILATPFMVPSTASITGIKFAPSQSASGSICGVLLDAGGGIIAMTNTLTLNAGSFGAYANLKFSPAQELTASTSYYYGVAQLVASTFPFGTASTFATTNLNLYYTVPIAGGSIGSAQNHMGYLGMNAVLGFSNTTLEASASKTIVCKQDGPGTVTLTATGMTTYTWAPGGQGASIVVTPTVVNANGNVNYNVTGTDGPSGCKSSLVVVSVSVSACAGLSSNTSNGYDIKLFPNPSVNGKSTITGLAGTNVITVYNAIGQVVLTQMVTEESVAIDLSNQPSGNYLVKITDTNNESRSVKIMNQN